MRRLFVIVVATLLVALMSAAAATAGQGGDQQQDQTQLQERDGSCDQSCEVDQDQDQDRDQDQVRERARDCVVADEVPAAPEGDEPATVGDQDQDRDRDRDQDRDRDRDRVRDVPSGAAEDVARTASSEQTGSAFRAGHSFHGGECPPLTTATGESAFGWLWEHGEDGCLVRAQWMFHHWMRVAMPF